MLPLLAATIISTSLSNSSTGGNVVQDGSVVTGSSYSSVSVQTYDSGSGGTSTVEIETDSNGKTNKQVITKAIPPGGSSDIYVATSTGDSKAEVRSFIHVGSSTTIASSSVEGSSTATASSSDAIPSFIPTSAPDFGAFWARIFSFFRFW